MVGTIKLKLHITQQEVNSDYVFETLFRISGKSEQAGFNHHQIAKEIVKLAARRGDDGLFAEDWKNLIEKYELSEHQYFSIIRTLKNAGILRKTKGKYYLIKEFQKHLAKMASAMNEFYMDLGVKL
jgi:hypothetical protein